MGSKIHLGLERLELDWGKNWHFRNHSRLFLPSDLALAAYHYVDAETGEPIVEHKPAYVRPLRDLVRRLDLLGFTFAGCRREYEGSIALIPDFYPDPALDFDLFMRAVSVADPARMQLPDPAEDWNLGEYVARNILADPEFTKTSEDLKSLTAIDGTFFENLHPYVTLRLLAENPGNLDRNVVWCYADVVDAGWASEDELYEGLGDHDKYLIVTEGKSDTAILRNSLPLVAPDVADFFDFVDMSENYPFTGVGNLFRFCQGLAQIRIQNRVVVLLDNDTAGRSAHARIQELPLPRNVVAMCLPDLPEFEDVQTLGPNGNSRENVNGRAVSIEAFLDLSRDGRTKPTIRWTSFDPQSGQYQGELTEQRRYVKEFLSEMDPEGDYDTSKLALLWDAIIAACALSA